MGTGRASRAAFHRWFQRVAAAFWADAAVAYPEKATLPWQSR